MGLTTMLTLFTCSLKWELRRERSVCGTPGQTYTSSVPDEHYLYILSSLRVRQQLMIGEMTTAKELVRREVSYCPIESLCGYIFTQVIS